MTKTTYNVEPLRKVEDIVAMKTALLEVGNRSKGKTGQRDQFLFTIGINTGLRISDIVTLKVGDLRGKSYATIIEQKTDKARRVPLTAISADINEYCDGMSNDDWLFPSNRAGGTHISTTQAYRILTRAGDWLGREDIGTHTMRKTFGYHYYKRTKDAATLTEIFGHAAPSITKRYIGINDDEIADSLKDFRL
ncbi:site-specific integrase [Bacillus sp. 37MA]|uniref:site-specific integrase n=1 Tax=Bacillus sp. 37MA TaxID=1132442 RepID=UPI0003638B4B|nr:site-specific integrase [Bacillus sp. 37MA]